jgi:prepilin-type N-terminal cleavage/methylation domain-containing protein
VARTGILSRKSGFTLVEVMCALTVLILVFLSSMAAVTIGFRLLEDARLSTLSSQVLQSEMENLRLKNWTQLSALPASGSFTVETNLNTASFNRFTCSRAISDVRADLKEVSLQLSWRSMDGRLHTRRYVTYIAKEGLNDYYYRRF